MFQFMATFRSLVRVFPLRGDEHEINDVGASYFKALRKFTLSQIQTGSDRCVQQLKRFPRPAEWIDLIPRRTDTPEIQGMSEPDAKEHRRAEGLRYRDQACSCRGCRDAEVSDKPIRFVPDLDRDGNERRVRDGERIVVAGHWAHGQELARWYQAKADFYNAYYAALAKTHMGKRHRAALQEAS